MIHFRKKNQAKYPLTPAEPSFYDVLKEFVEAYKPAIGVIIVVACIIILMMLFYQAATTGHLHMLSSEANQYEHMTQIIFYGGV